MTGHLQDGAAADRGRVNALLWKAPEQLGLYRLEQNEAGFLSRHFHQLQERLEAFSSVNSGGGQAASPAASAQRQTHTELLPTEESLEAQLFDARIKLKMETAPVSMHLGSDWRASIFRQIDSLFDVDNWDDDSNLPNVASYKTFLRFIIHEGIAPLPAVGIGNLGNLLATYYSSHDITISFEFFASDRCRLIFHRKGPDGDEAVARDGPTQGTIAFLTNLGVTLCKWSNE